MESEEKIFVVGGEKAADGEKVKKILYNFIVTVKTPEGKLIKRTRIVQYSAPDKAYRDSLRNMEKYDDSFTKVEGLQVTVVEVTADGKPIAPVAKLVKQTDRKSA